MLLVIKLWAFVVAIVLRWLFKKKWPLLTVFIVSDSKS